MAYFSDLEQTFQKFIWNQKAFQRASALLRKQKQSWRLSRYLITNHTTSLWSSKQLGTGIETGIQSSGTEQTAQKSTHDFMVN